MPYEITKGTPALYRRPHDENWKGGLTKQPLFFKWYTRKEGPWLVFTMKDGLEVRVPERYTSGFNLPLKLPLR